MRSSSRKVQSFATLIALAAISCGEVEVDPTSTTAASSGGSGGTPQGVGGSQGGDEAQGGSTGSQGGNTECGDCQGFDCCDGVCVNTQNDVHNCGTCGNGCVGDVPYCDHGQCGAPPCGGNACLGDVFCCGTLCCESGQLCCSVPGPVGEMLGCYDAGDGGTCPMGCVICKCAAEGTLVATPAGERPIETLVTGDVVYAEVDAAIIATPLAWTSRTPVDGHEVIRVSLANGAEFAMSEGHPLGDGRVVGDLRAGHLIDDVLVVAVAREPYERGFTYDILPARGTGRWITGGVLVGSSLK